MPNLIPKTVIPSETKDPNRNAASASATKAPLLCLKPETYNL